MFPLNFSALSSFQFVSFLWIGILFCTGCSPDEKAMTTMKWHTLTLSFEGPETSESGPENPFTDYRLMVTFSHEGKSITIPGFYAADGNAGNTQSETGKIWQVRFTPDELGAWTYKASFRKGANIAVEEDPAAGEPVGFDGKSGKFTVIPSGKTGSDFRAHGRLNYVGKRYLKYGETGKYFIKVGADSPENFLAFRDFDATYSSWPKDDGKDDSGAGEAYAGQKVKDFTKTWEPHIRDWKEGDPTWGDGKGKGIIGALNYLASKGMNVVYMLTMNIEGDGRDVWPYRDHEDVTRFDCSKLDQWEIVFNHAQSLGIMLHFVTQETENEKLLDNGDTGFQRKLYYRELVARFGHHLAITWNLGEENGPASFSPNGQSNEQREAMAAWFQAHDPYQNCLVIHTHSHKSSRDSMISYLLGNTDFDGLSVQQGKPSEVHDVIKQWIDQSAEANHQWVVNMDELGPHFSGAFPDEVDPQHDTIRHEVLWGTLMAGGAGVEWYFGYIYAHSDLSCQDWRSRDLLWNQSKHALDFFTAHLPFVEMESADELTDAKEDYCFAKKGEVYAIYLPKGGTTDLDLSGYSGTFSVNWYNPRTGGELQKGSVASIKGGSEVGIGSAPSDDGKDWVALVKK